MKVYVVGNSQRPLFILIDVLLLTSVIVNLFLSVPLGLLLILNAVIFSWLVFYGTIHYIIS